ncbi:hypothetical protein FNW02_02800 [Komarekiella sp. 'clone 1']|uniref:Uncharacterized protein n=1 Tax=Komarekiella delphini-convector SJRDD-AB1 TaxID=2593771 RepID=A0AA40STL1_9NOST|nr:hypothetical protein [Komarekiella delphini-convector]MBD6614814.1 hypothetical protein [Komarekiella delphini-convector SJRDD-AB1]
MNKTNNLTQLKSATATLIVPLYILATFTTSSAEVPKTAVIHYASDPGVRLLLGATDSMVAKPGQRMQQYKDAVGVPGSKKSLSRLSLPNPTHNKIGALVQAGPAPVSSVYTFPCKVSGSVYFGWRKQGGSCSHGLWVVPVASQLHSSKVPSLASKNTHSATASKNLRQAQAVSNLVKYYCSTVTTSKIDQWITSAGLPSLETACQEASQKCEETTGSKCLVASLGDWSVNDPNLAVSMQCGSNQSSVISARTRQGNGSLIDRLLLEITQMSQAVKGINCAASIYHPNEVIVSPSNDELTLIQTNDNGGNVEINVLVGSVNIVSVGRTSGFKVNKGFRYSLGENKPTPLDCDRIFKSQPVQEFLNTANWPQEVTGELQSYRSGFCKSPERPTDNGTGPVIDIIFPRGGGGGGGGGGSQTTPGVGSP